MKKRRQAAVLQITLADRISSTAPEIAEKPRCLVSYEMSRHPIYLLVAPVAQLCEVAAAVVV